MSNQKPDQLFLLLSRGKWLLASTVLLSLTSFTFATCLYLEVFALPMQKAEREDQQHQTQLWMAPHPDEIPATPEGDLIRYGQELINHTSIYLGPKGIVKPISNGMNCKNCHLMGGQKAYGINYGAVASTYPQLRERTGSTVDVKERVNECIERSLNGTRLDSLDRELLAIEAYLLWIGKDVPKGVVPNGTGMKKVRYLDRPADPVKGEMVFKKNCVECHGANGEGVMEDNGLEWKYPPLYGEHSYNVGAGMFRISKFASFVRYSMPYGISFEQPVLTEEEAWDVAAFVNSMPHPGKDLSMDWPDISKKPIDHPFGPYADELSETQHKYGPYIKMIQ